MKIGILYIALGDYSIFFDGFYKSIEENFLTDDEKTYYVFTDSKVLLDKSIKNVIWIEKKDMGWPYNTLMRFDFFKSVENLLQKEDYLYFFNANSYVIKPISRLEIIPENRNDYLVSLFWTRVNNLQKFKVPYERNWKSKAYISFDKGNYYFQGGINGGRTKEYLKLATICQKWRIEDESKGLIPIHNDESYINKYLMDKNPLMLDEKYGMPEEWGIGSDTSIKLIKKDNLIKVSNIKKNGKGQTILKRIRNKMNLLKYMVYYFYLRRNENE